MPHNIEKSAFRKGEYVGYGAGKVWRIRKETDIWRATNAHDMADATRYTARTLRDLSPKLEG